MRDRRLMAQRWRNGTASVLGTLVRLRGSGYRQPGARLMICNDGSYEGGISAGCLEAEVVRKAAWLVRDGAVVESYSTLLDDSTEIPFGLGCGGVIDILLETVESPECRGFMEAIEASLSGQERLIATWLPGAGRALARATFTADGEIIFASGSLTAECIRCARAKCLDPTNSGQEDIFVERLMPPQRLYVFGAGDDAQPLVTMANLLGWNVTVIDGRSQLARKERFVEVVVKVANAESALIQQVNRQDAVVVMTHSYEQDRDYIASLLPLRPRYFGLLGSRRRSSLLIAETAAKIGWSISECCEQISAPVGLDIGGEGSEAIALAIMAEIQARCMGKPTGSRRLSAEHVQNYLADSDARSYLQSQCGIAGA